MKFRTIFWFWLPLAFSFLLMTFEGPWVQGVMSRKADAETQLAAFGLMLALQILIESPVIMFSAVGSALTRDRQSYDVLWRYTNAVNVLVTILAVLFAFTPLLDLYFGKLLGIPQHIIDATRLPMVIMILWSAFIGHRRFHQGVLISAGHTKSISNGTIVRIIFSASIAIGLGVWTQLPGAVIGAYSLIFAVTAEMVYIYLASRPDVTAYRAIEREPQQPPLTYRKAMRFHVPLAMTSVASLFTLPVIQSGLAKGPDAEQVLAAFPVVFSILLVMRSGGLAWQEAVIALSKGPEEVRSLRRFTWILGLGTTGLTAIIALTPIIDGYTGFVLDVPEHLMPLIVTGVMIGVLVPLFSALQSYLRAMLMRVDTTGPITTGMVIGLASLSAIMWAGIHLNYPGIAVASAAMTGGAGLELVYLWWAFSTRVTRLDSVWQVAPAVGD